MSYKTSQLNCWMNVTQMSKSNPRWHLSLANPSIMQRQSWTDEARVDIAARGVWVKGQMALFDVRVFNPIAKAYLTSDLSAAYRRNELEKKRAYGRRIRKVDQASFTPLIFSCLGGMGKESLVFYKRLAQSLADRRNQDYATTANWLRARLSFSLIRSCLLCIRGSRSVFAKNDAAEEIEIRRAVVEALPHRHR